MQWYEWWENWIIIKGRWSRYRLATKFWIIKKYTFYEMWTIIVR